MLTQEENCSLAALAASKMEMDRSRERFLPTDYCLHSCLGMSTITAGKKTSVMQLRLAPIAVEDTTLTLNHFVC